MKNNPFSFATFINFIIINMSESGVNVCKIGYEEIPGDHRDSSMNSHTSTTDVKRVICNECLGSLHGESSKIKLEDVPSDGIGFTKDILKIVEVPCESNFFNCYQCEYSTVDKTTLIQHVIIHQDNHNEVSIKDEVLEDTKPVDLVEFNKTNSIKHCDKTNFKGDVFNYSPVRSTHPKEHREKSHKCTICDYTSRWLSALNQHMRTHTGEKPYKCKICDFSAAQSNNLKQHMCIHTGEKAYKCNVCEYSSIRSVELKQHTRIHTGEKPYKCKICDFSAAYSSNFKRHVRTHAEKKPYKCKFCDYSCAESYLLKRHTMTHTGEKPYNCKICHFFTAHLSSLNQHMRTHAEEKPYKCKICGFSTAHSQSLKPHMRTHTEEKPYKCNVCNFSSAYLQSLKRHIHTHIADKSIS